MLAAKARLILALDVPNQGEARRLVSLLQDEVGLFKVGLELFMAAGPRFLETLAAELPGRIFLDLKFHDIPATVQGALGHLPQGVAMTTVHTDQGPSGLKAVSQGSAGDVKLLAVTILTSLSSDDLLSLGYDPQYAQDPARLVLLRARLAHEAGCHGVICSGREARTVKDALGEDFLVVCPGIRPAWAVVPGDDQKRPVTPYEAIKNRADYLVVGRPIRQAPDPVAAARQTAAEIEEGLKER
jgi:orotidine-5'-phosphate decarboxylase